MNRRLFSMLALILMAITGAWAETIDLSTVSVATTAKNGDVLTGILGTNVQISIADKATVTLDGVTINGTNSSAYQYGGITCEGDATIILENENTVTGFNSEYPGIYIAMGNTLTIWGNGSLTVSSNGDAAGIGGGWYRDCGNIVINGGNITATGGTNSAGIGGGNGASCGNIRITGGNIIATGGESATGIGAGCDKSCGNITIEGGNINATGGSYAAGIGGGSSALCGNITITGGNITATSGNPLASSIGAGYPGTCGTVTIGGAARGSITKSPYYYLSLADDKDNSSTLTTYNKKTSDVTLKRTLQTGGWNTFSVPFSMANPSGWTVKELTNASYDSGTKTLSLTFGTASSIVAGHAYLVQVGAAKVVNPTFNNVEIVNGTTATTITGVVEFVPAINPTTLTLNDKSCLFVSGGNTLTWASSGTSMNGFRAYFHILNDDIVNARAFSMSFGDEETGIESLTISPEGERTEAFPREGLDGVFYDLQGRRIENLPTAKGIYIQNGRKIIIRSTTQGDACQSKN